MKWIASGDRVMHPGVHGQLPGADHEFMVYGGSEQAGALVETINADLGALQNLLREVRDNIRFTEFDDDLWDRIDNAVR